jgi:molybdopterin-guanine dinucleotide biosynthesis protein A
MDIDAFILVGGRSSRMGRDKACLELDGKTLVDRAAAAIAEGLAPTRITLVAAGPEQVLTIFGHEHSFSFVFDVHPNRGPFGAVHAALANARTEWIFVMACDLPLVTAEFLQVLSQYVAGDIDAVAPIQDDGKPQPLCALYRVEPCLAVIDAIFVRNRPSPAVRWIFDQVAARLVRPSEAPILENAHDLFLNLNTREDLETARRMIGK